MQQCILKQHVKSFNKIEDAVYIMPLSKASGLSNHVFFNIINVPAKKYESRCGIIAASVAIHRKTKKNLKAVFLWLVKVFDVVVNLGSDFINHVSYFFVEKNERQNMEVSLKGGLASYLRAYNNFQQLDGHFIEGIINCYTMFSIFVRQNNRQQCPENRLYFKERIQIFVKKINADFCTIGSTLGHYVVESDRSLIAYYRIYILHQIATSDRNFTVIASVPDDTKISPRDTLLKKALAESIKTSKMEEQKRVQKRATERKRGRRHVLKGLKVKISKDLKTVEATLHDVKEELKNLQTLIILLRQDMLILNRRGMFGALAKKSTDLDIVTKKEKQLELKIKNLTENQRTYEFLLSDDSI
jgi:hypothetical protein